MYFLVLIFYSLRCCSDLHRTFGWCHLPVKFIIQQPLPWRKGTFVAILLSFSPLPSKGLKHPLHHLSTLGNLIKRKSALA